jgi:hypothetical protein
MMASTLISLPWAYFAEVATKAEWEGSKGRGKIGEFFTPTSVVLDSAAFDMSSGRM